MNRSPQGEDHEGIEAALRRIDVEASSLGWKGSALLIREDVRKLRGLLSRVSAPERNTVRLVERLRSGLLLIAQDTALSAETHRLMAQDLLTEFPVSGESENER